MTRKIDFEEGIDMSTKIGIGWYRPEQWELLKSSVVDRDVIEDTFFEWFEFVTAQFDDMESKGLEPVRVDIDVEEMITWCKRNQLPLNAEARSEFIASKIKEQCEN